MNIVFKTETISTPILLSITEGLYADGVGVSMALNFSYCLVIALAKLRFSTIQTV